MNLHASEAELFAEWSIKRPGFVADGVVDEDAYLQSSPRLLFVLEEVNDPDGGGWDLREFIRNGARDETWNNITRWVEGIRKLPGDIPWNEVEEIDGERRRQTLKSIAAVNLKKSPGGCITNSAAFAKIAEEDRAFLNRQFALYDPDIIICCGTSTNGVFHWLVQIVQQPQWRHTLRGIWFHQYRAGEYVVAYSHPEARCAASLLYYGLVDAIREILTLEPNTALNSDMSEAPHRT